MTKDELDRITWNYIEPLEQRIKDLHEHVDAAEEDLETLVKALEKLVPEEEK